jgi:SAM-dependent methyltransferase
MSKNKREDMYITGEYLENNPDWDSADSEWKAKQIYAMCKKHKILDLRSVSEVGCGSGEILFNISKNFDKDTKYFGYDISPQAIEMANKNESKKENFNFKMLSVPDIKSDVLICADVFEHISDEFNFLTNIREMGEYKIFNIPLDLSVQSIIREDTILSQRKRVGHINYYTKSLALETLKDTGYHIVDHKYGTWYKHYKAEGVVTKIVNIFRDVLMPINPDLCVKWLGGSSLIVLAK